MIMVTFNLKTVAIGVAVCTVAGAIGVKYVEFKVNKLVHRNETINKVNEEFKRMHIHTSKHISFKEDVNEWTKKRNRMRVNRD